MIINQPGPAHILTSGSQLDKLEFPVSGEDLNLLEILIRFLSNFMINISIPGRIGISEDQIEIHQSLLHAEIILLELNDIVRF